MTSFLYNIITFRQINLYHSVTDPCRKAREFISKFHIAHISLKYNRGVYLSNIIASENLPFTRLQGLINYNKHVARVSL